MHRVAPLFMILMLVACQSTIPQEGEPDTPIPSAIPAATQTSAPTVTISPITPALTTVEPDHEFDGIRLHSTQGKFTMHYRREEEVYGLPPHYQFIGHNPPMGGGIPTDLLILPASLYPEDVVELQRTLDEMPQHMEIDDTRQMPQLPDTNYFWSGEKQYLAAHIEYMRFQNGSGVRYLTFHSPIPINEERVLTYTFQGLTNDGQWYVTFVTAAKYDDIGADGKELPEGVTFNENNNGFSGDSRAYFHMMTQKIETVNPDEFTPELPSLDEMMRSLRIEPLGMAMTPSPMPPTPTAAVTIIPAPEVMPNASAESVTFYLDPALADGYRAEHVAMETQIDPGVGLPAHLRINLIGYAFESRGEYANIYILPLDDEDFYGNEALLQAAQRLREFLPQRFTSFGMVSSPMGGIPHLPVGDSQSLGIVQYLLAQIRYMDFQSGTGVRYVTAYAGEIGPLTNGSLYYSFHGLTHDGRYGVAIYMPIRYPGLANTNEDIPGWPENNETFRQNYDSYFEANLRLLEAAAPSEFTPSLAGLDALVQSIRIEVP